MTPSELDQLVTALLPLIDALVEAKLSTRATATPPTTPSTTPSTPEQAPTPPTPQTSDRPRRIRVKGVHGLDVRVDPVLVRAVLQMRMFGVRDLENVLGRRRSVTTNDLIKEMFGSIEGLPERMAQNFLGKLLKEIGWKHRLVQRDGKRGWIWEPSDAEVPKRGRPFKAPVNASSPRGSGAP